MTQAATSTAVSDAPSSERATQPQKGTKSVITCDLEGRIETFSSGAESIFGYSADEIVGKKRVSLFSPGLIVLGHVGNWLETAKTEGEYSGRTVFVRKDGSRFAARIRITPTFRSRKDQTREDPGSDEEREHIGYCGVTEPLELDPAEAMPEIGLGTRVFRWLVVTRAPFLTATLVPILVAAAWVAGTGAVATFPWLAFALALVGALALHVAANTFNDYFDWRSGSDEANNDYFLPFSGGSRSIELGLVTERGLWRIANVSMLVAAACGVGLTVLVGPALLLFGAVGAFAVYFYTAPPLRLVARRGLGELTVGLCFGPLMTAGAVYAMTGELTGAGVLIGVPVGLLTAAILWINEFPDAPADEATGKRHLVVVLGTEAARWGYVGLLASAFCIVPISVALGALPAGALWLLLGLPLAVYSTTILFKHYADRTLVKANAATIQLQLLAGLAMAAGMLWS